MIFRISEGRLKLESKLHEYHDINQNDRAFRCVVEIKNIIKMIIFIVRNPLFKRNSKMNLLQIRSHLSKFAVGIAGAGGLGSNCAVALARCGIGKIVICDHDVIEAGNLNRQYYFSDQVGRCKAEALRENILRIDPSIKVVVYKEKITRNNVVSLFGGCDIIVEALDKAETKEMFIETVQVLLKGVPLITGSGLAGWGHFDKLKVRKIDDTLFLCGDEISEQSEETPMLAPRVAIVANMQANIVIDLLLKKALS